MTNNVTPIFKYQPKTMGQCPQCRGYQVLINCPPPITAGPAAQAEWEEIMRAHPGTGWQCLECDCYF